MKEAFHITIETLHAPGKGDLENVSHVLLYRVRIAVLDCSCESSMYILPPPSPLRVIL